MQGVRIGTRIAAVSVLAALAVLSAAAAAPRTALPRVTVIGDSVASALGSNPPAVTILGEGVNLDLELAPCRRVGQDSCPFEGVRPPNVIQYVQSKGIALGQTVVVVVGYNDFEDAYATNIEDALTALQKAGVTHVLWATLRAVHHPYLTMNDAIVVAAARHPELTVVDWNVYSRSHPDWFQADGLHLDDAGAVAMARLIHSALEGLQIPLAPQPPPATTAAAPAISVATPRLPDAREGKPYTVALAARGGSAPYRWSSAARLPPGLHLTAAGRLSGVARARPGTFVVRLRVVDASGAAAAARLALRIRG